MSTLEEQIEDIHRNFSRIYPGGIPAIITDESAFLSFICALAATEALAGYRYSDVRESGKRFKKFSKSTFRNHTKIAAAKDAQNVNMPENHKPKSPCHRSKAS